MNHVIIEPSSTGYVCYHTSDPNVVHRCMAKGGRELSQKEVERIFGNLVSYASPLSTTVSADGQTVTFTPPEQDDLNAAAEKTVRQKRNRLLVQTDYLVMPDYPLDAEKKAAVLAYRQALRDVPEQAGFPRQIDWPVKP